MKIVIIGTGYVGLVTGACLAEIGHHITCLDINPEKIQDLKSGTCPIYEPGLETYLNRNLANKRLRFETLLPIHIKDCDLIMIAVGTPPLENGDADLSSVKSVSSFIGQHINIQTHVLLKSTVPIGTNDQCEEIIHQELKKRSLPPFVRLIANPEFLREGQAVKDFMEPDRIIIGCIDDESSAIAKAVYRQLINQNPHRLMIMHRRAAELVKYAANTMLASRISFINELSQLCHRANIPIDDIRHGLATDPRIGSQFLQPGPGFGGSCFPKDVMALKAQMKHFELIPHMMNAIETVNLSQPKYLVDVIHERMSLLSKKPLTLAIWGLSFKPNTDDVRDTPSLAIINSLEQKGYNLKLHDPVAMTNFETIKPATSQIRYAQSPLDAVKDADALVLLTEWQDYRWPNWTEILNSISEPIIFDFRNLYDQDYLTRQGFEIIPLGGRGDLTKDLPSLLDD